MRPWTYTLFSAALALLAGTLLLVSEDGARAPLAFLVGALGTGLALGMYLTERNDAVQLSPEQEQRVRRLVREGRKLKAIRRVHATGHANLGAAFRYVHRVARQEFARS